MALLNSYDSIESKIKFTIEKTHPHLSEYAVQSVCNIAMRSVIDEMQNTYEAALEHCGSIDPGAWIRNEIRDLKVELFNKLTK